MLPLIKKEGKKYKSAKPCHICKEKFNEIVNGNENYRRFVITAHGICKARYKRPKEIPMVLHDGSLLSDYHFIIIN